MSSSMVNVVTILVVAALRRARRHADLLDERLGGRLHRRPWRRLRVDGPERGAVRFHIAQVRELGGYLCGRRLYETMLPWETDPSPRDIQLGAAFADVWCAIPKVVFSRTPDRVQGNVRLGEASVGAEAAMGCHTNRRPQNSSREPAIIPPAARPRTSRHRHSTGAATTSAPAPAGQAHGNGSRGVEGALPSAPAPAPSTRRSEHTRTLSERSVAARPSSSAAVAQAG